MQMTKQLMRWLSGNSLAVMVVWLLAGCQAAHHHEPAPTAAVAPTPTAAPAPTPTPTPAAPATAAAVVAAPAAVPAPPAVPKPPVRIKAGPMDPFKDADGNQWLAETGFVEGNTVERPDLTIANTKTPAIYHSERYNMTSFSYPVPNGKYVVKLHFCETYEGISGPKERVFTFNVEGHEFKDFDLWVKAGGPLRAYIETVNVDVTDGKLDITFTPQVEYPEINGIEILPAN